MYHNQNQADDDVLRACGVWTCTVPTVGVPSLTFGIAPQAEPTVGAPSPTSDGATEYYLTFMPPSEPAIGALSSFGILQTTEPILDARSPALDAATEHLVQRYNRQHHVLRHIVRHDLHVV